MTRNSARGLTRPYATGERERRWQEPRVIPHHQWGLSTRQRARVVGGGGASPAPREWREPGPENGGYVAFPALAETE